MLHFRAQQLSCVSKYGDSTQNGILISFFQLSLFDQTEISFNEKFKFDKAGMIKKILTIPFK